MTSTRAEPNPNRNPAVRLLFKEISIVMAVILPGMIEPRKLINIALKKTAITANIDVKTEKIMQKRIKTVLCREGGPQDSFRVRREFNMWNVLGSNRIFLANTQNSLKLRPSKAFRWLLSCMLYSKYQCPGH